MGMAVFFLCKKQAENRIVSLACLFPGISRILSVSEYNDLSFIKIKVYFCVLINYNYHKSKFREMIW